MENHDLMENMVQNCYIVIIYFMSGFSVAEGQKASLVQARLWEMKRRVKK